MDIDTGEVSVLEREILNSLGFKHTPPATKLTLRYLESRSPAANKIFRTGVVKLGGAAQRVASTLTKPLQKLEGAEGFYPLAMLKSSIGPTPSKTLRDLTPKCEADQALVFEPESGAGKDVRTVFYFPGCGSERLFSDVSMATIHLLLETGVRVVLPPPFLCCGFPAHANAKTAQHSRTVLRDSILFAQIREMFGHVDFDGCVVSCGTCREGLVAMNAEGLFGRIVDVAAYLAERGLRVEGAEAAIYHSPCHDSLGGKAKDVLKQLGGYGKMTAVPHCCSEAGTLSLSRPDITGTMLERKREALKAAANEQAKPTVLTNCPSCIQGLGRNRDIVKPQHIAVALAERYSGADWERRFRTQAEKAGAVRF